MNTRIQNEKRLNIRFGSLNKMLLASLLVLATASGQATDSYQLKVLFTPSDSILLAEAKGRIMIYDGLKSETVDLAMNEQFDRIENMMFVRTQYVQEDGEYEVEDDEC